MPGCFEIDNELRFEKDPHGFKIARIDNDLCSAKIALHGAHVLSYIPKGGEELFFISEKSYFEPLRPIRGGIPVCWPWFGSHPADESLPGHGFARLLEWQVASSRSLPECTELVLSLQDNDYTRAMFDYNFMIEAVIRAGRSFEIALKVTNTDSRSFDFSAALHSYFTVSDIRKVTLHGLDSRKYIDTLDDSVHTQYGDMSFKAETDLLFEDSSDVCVINDSGRRIVIDKDGSNSSVVWNPWITKAARMPDFGDEEYLRMLCVETTNAGKDARTLRSGETHQLKAEFKIID